MTRTTPVELTNMIMIENPQTHEILVEDRQNPTWPGVTFPGGHIEADAEGVKDFSEIIELAKTLEAPTEIETGKIVEL